MGAAVILGILIIGVVIGLLLGKENITPQSHPMYGVYNSTLEGSFSNQVPFEREFWSNGKSGGPLFQPVSVDDSGSSCNKSANNSIALNLKDDY
jgi:hypothetical protein